MGKHLASGRPGGWAGGGRPNLASFRTTASLAILAVTLTAQVHAAQQFTVKLPSRDIAEVDKTQWGEAELRPLMQIALATRRSLDEVRPPRPALNALKSDVDLSELTHVLLATWLANGGDLADDAALADDRARHASLPPALPKPKELRKQVAALTPPDYQLKTATDAPVVSGPLPKKNLAASKDDAPARVAALPPADHAVEPKPDKDDLPTVAEAPAIRFNPTGRDIDLQVPFKDDGREIGSVLLRLGADDSLSLDAEGVLPLLEELFDPDVLEQLSGAAEEGRLTPKSFQVASLDLEYDPGLLELSLVTPVESRKDQVVSLAEKRSIRPMSMSRMRSRAMSTSSPASRTPPMPARAKVKMRRSTGNSISS